MPEKTRNCYKCQSALPVSARFCPQCGARLAGGFEQVNWLTVEHPQEALSDYFFVLFQRILEDEHPGKSFPLFNERLYRSGFRETVDLRVRQLSAELEKTSRSAAAFSHYLRGQLEGLVDYFTLQQAADLLATPLSPGMQRYLDGKTLPASAWFPLIMDYLGFDPETDQVYTDFLKMPVEQIKQVSQSYLFPDKGEHIYFICDLGMVGTGKLGFAMTEKALYWKAPLQKARKVTYTAFESAHRESNWIHINGYFFNATPVLNLRLMKLLRKMHWLATAPLSPGQAIEFD